MSAPAALRMGAWNLRVNRDPSTVAGEVSALLEDERLDVLAVCEAWQYDRQLARLVGFDYHTSRGKDPSARDAGILVRHGIPVRGYRLTRTGVTWKRAKGPGQHWARSLPSLVVPPAGRVVSVHAPPRYAGKLATAAVWARLVVLLAGRRRFVAIGDYNATARDSGPFSPHALAMATHGRLIGAERIDHALVRGLRVTNVRRGPRRGSDHFPLLMDVAAGTPPR